MTYAARTSRRTASPDFCSAQYRSYPACISIHIRAGVPKHASRRNAVSELMPRRSATISWMRCGGTRSLSASAFAESPRASSSSFRIAPGWTCSNAGWATGSSFSMIIDYFNIMRVAVLEPENQSPRAIDRYRPLPLPFAAQSMEADRVEWRNIVERTRRPQYLQPRKRLGAIHPAELRFAVNGKSLGRTVGITCDHTKLVACTA